MATLKTKDVCVEEPTRKVVVDFIDRGTVTLEVDEMGMLRVLVEGAESGSMWPIHLDQTVPFQTQASEDGTSEPEEGA